jgi:DNA-binding transcriptional ArsR family regulator
VGTGRIRVAIAGSLVPCAPHLGDDHAAPVAIEQEPISTHKSKEQEESLTVLGFPLKPDVLLGLRGQHQLGIGHQGLQPSRCVPEGDGAVGHPSPSDLDAVQVARTFGISYETVRRHLKNIYRKLQVHSRREAERVFTRDKRERRRSI